MAFDFPATPATNQTVTMPDGTVRRWDGIKWVAGQTPQSPTCTYGDTPPASPAPGVLWFDTVSCQMFLWYNDGSSSQWVPTVAIPASIGEAPVDSNIYGRINGAWTNLLAAQQIQGNNGRNLLHNSVFNIAQRGAGPFTANAVYTLDRWQLAFVNDTSVNVQQIALSDGNRGVIGDEYATAALQVTTVGSATAGSYTIVYQSIEQVRRLAGKTVTISFWAACSVANFKLLVSGYSSYGTGGSTSAPAGFTGIPTFTLSTGWTKYSGTFSIPSLAGKTFGTNGGTDSNVLQIVLSQVGSVGAQTGTVQLWGVQLEIGNKATQLEKIEYIDDLRHCQRFFVSPVRIYFLGYGVAATNLAVPLTLPTLMRAVPTMTITTQNSVNVTTPTITAYNAMTVYAGGTATATSGYQLDIYATASADF